MMNSKNRLKGVLKIICLVTALTIVALIIRLFAVCGNMQFTSAASDSVYGKLNGNSRNIQLLLTSEGVERSKINAFVAHVESVRLAGINGTNFRQEERDIPEEDVFAGIDYIPGFRSNSETGQHFMTYRIFHENIEQARTQLLPKLSEHGGWCYIDSDDVLVCEIPMRIASS